MRVLYRILLIPIVFVRQATRTLSTRFAGTAGVRTRFGEGLMAAITRVAPLWRRSIRAMIVLFGFALFAASQFVMGYFAISNMMWLTLIAVLSAAALAVVAFKWPFVTFLVWLVLSPFTRRLIVYHPPGLPPINFDSVAVILVTVAAIIRICVRKKKLAAPSVAEWLFIAFIVYVLLNKVIRGEMTLNYSQIFFYTIGLWIIIYFATKAIIERPEQIRIAAVGLVIMSTLCAVSMVYEAYAGQSYLSLIYRVSVPLATRDIGVGGRARGPFDDPDEPAVLLASGVILCIFLFSYSKKWLGKLMYLAASATIVVAIAYTYTRNVYITSLVFLLLMTVLTRERRKIYLLLLTGVVVAATFLTPILLTDKAFYRRITDPTTALQRIVFMRSSMKMIKHNFWFGVGWLNSETELPKYVTSLKQYEGLKSGWHGLYGRDRPTFVHNTYLYLTQEEGIIGAVLYFGAILAFLSIMLGGLKRLPQKGVLGRDILVVFIAALISWFVSITTYANQGKYTGNYVFWVTIALAIRLIEMHRQQRRDSSASTAAQSQAKLPVSSGLRE